eukprot:CAMPEP_0183811156 /NCGR_PEP_ID=MMETSP0803_2-20130417/48832_1 /TAXON_ID=195967 /ORGANISM="Crustomastix stigmata, Strain CCMP3273" /LENGTH=58 /DNA_ID=CAMNT_0026055985 /DNA_START=92 /DNA_END=265 /DNA_ORIENTATION=-
MRASSVGMLLLVSSHALACASPTASSQSLTQHGGSPARAMTPSTSCTDPLAKCSTCTA